MAPQEKQTELQQLLTQEADLSARYTDDYPDVVSVRRQIKELRQQMAKALRLRRRRCLRLRRRRRVTRWRVQQLRAQLRSMDQAIAQKRRDQGAIQAQLRMYQDRVSSSPQVEEEYKSITRGQSDPHRPSMTTC